MNGFEIIQPDDFHVHLREGEAMRTYAQASACVFKRVLVMPNTSIPITNGERADEYRLQIKNAAPDLFPVMSIYLTKETAPETIIDAHKRYVKAVKFYPRDATTNSGHGLTTPELLDKYDVFSAMQDCGMVLCLHGEETVLPVLQREHGFIDVVRVLAKDFPKLKIVFEHITTEAAVRAVRQLPQTVAATITLHHLMLTTDAVIGDHDCLCMPVAKSWEDRRELLRAATLGHRRFFFGSDSAPHPRSSKNQAKGKFGLYTAPVAIQALAQVFEKHDNLGSLEDFTSKFGAEWYELPRNTKRIELYKEKWTVPDPIAGEHDPAKTVRPFMAGEELSWKVRTD